MKSGTVLPGGFSKSTEFSLQRYDIRTVVTPVFWDARLGSQRRGRRFCPSRSRWRSGVGDRVKFHAQTMWDFCPFRKLDPFQGIPRHPCEVLHAQKVRMKPSTTRPRSFCAEPLAYDPGVSDVTVIPAVLLRGLSQTLFQMRGKLSFISSWTATTFKRTALCDVTIQWSGGGMNALHHIGSRI